MTTANTEKKKINEIISYCESFRQQLVSYCLRYDCTVEEAEDCVSAAYEKLIEQLFKQNEIVNPRAWLYKVSLNNIKALEKQKAKEKIFEYEDNESKDAALEKLAVNIDYLESYVTDKAIERCAVKILSQLDSEEKELYLLYYRGNKRLKEIAELMSLSESNVRKRKQRLKEKLNYLVKKYADEMYLIENNDEGGKQ